MQAVILAAGKSTRTYPLTLTRPKPLLKVANKPVIEHQLDALEGLVKSVVLVVGYKAEMIKEYLGDSYKGIQILYAEQKEQKGTFDALKSAEAVLEDQFLVLNGDDMYGKKDIEHCISQYSILAHEVDDPKRFGIVRGSDNLEGIEEKPQSPTSNLANTGLFFLPKTVLSCVPEPSERGELELTDAVSVLAQEEQIAIKKVVECWFPIGYPWNLLEANEFFLKKITESKTLGIVEENVTLKGPVHIGKGSVLKSGTYIEGPVTIGENCVIGPNCFIRPYTSIGNNCTVGQGMEVKNSIYFDNTKSAHLSYIGDSILGESVNIGGGTMVANLRHDKKTISSQVNGTLVETGRKKLGTVIGDHCKIGASTIIYPGRKIWPNKTTLPAEQITEDKI